MIDRENRKRVIELYTLMVDGYHQGRTTLMQKAELWGITLAEAECLNVEACRILRRRKYQEDPKLKATISDRIEELVHRALARMKQARG